MNIAGLSIGQPAFLWALLVCPLLALFALRSRLDASRLRLATATLFRALCVALVVLAVADARVRWATRALAVALVVDRSASVPASEGEAARAAFTPQRLEQGDVRFAAVRTALDAQGARPLETELETAVTAALGALPDDRIRRIVLATDGRETRGDVRAAIERARAAGATVSVLPLGERAEVDRVALSGLDTARLVRAGRDASVSAQVFSSRPQRVTLELVRDGVTVARRELDAPQGSSQHDVSVPFPDEGVHELVARVRAEGDRVEENNTYRALVRVVPPPRVLLVHELPSGSPALAAVYRDAHLAVDEALPGDVPTTTAGFNRYQLVVLDELVLTTLTEPQQRALHAWVEERGGGLLTTTGMHGVGRLPEVLRELEPIMPPRAVREPRPVELILVVDRSGSMMGRPIVSARAAATAAVRALRPDSRVGLVAFSGAADTQVGPVPMEQADEVLGAIGGIRASGGTDLAAALNAAARMVTNDDRYLHHVILFSDGESQPAAAIAAAQELRNTGATITAITLGPRIATMSSIAQIGRGRYHVTRTPTALPALFVREAQFRSPPPAREAVFRPALAARMGFLDGVNPASDPPLLGFVAAQPRPGALTLLQTPDGGPLLAHWFFGLGQVATLTSATSSRWADRWRTGEGFRRMFSQMAWEMLRTQSEDNLELHVERVPGRAELRRVYAVAPTNQASVAPLVFLSRGLREGVRLPLHASGPGVWSANVTVGTGFVVDARMPASLEPSVAAGAEQPYADELRAFGADLPTLEALARVGGGRVLARAEQALENVQRERVPRDMRVPLLVAALLAYLLSTLALRLPGGGVGAWLKARAAQRGGAATDVSAVEETPARGVQAAGAWRASSPG